MNIDIKQVESLANATLVRFSSDSVKSEYHFTRLYDGRNGDVTLTIATNLLNAAKDPTAFLAREVIAHFKAFEKGGV